MPTRHASAPVVAGIRVSHADRLVYPDLGITKLDLARYYEEIADWVMPHVGGRPLTLKHCPAGVTGPCMFLRHAKAWGPTALRRVHIREKTKVGEYLVADSPAAVVALAQMGVIEIHTWNSLADDVEHPNRIVWDLDPGPEVSWKQTVSAARRLRQLLKKFDLASWVKTTGGHGIHVVVAIVPSLDWSACLAFSLAVSKALARTSPGLFTTSFAKQGRERKILIDYLRNNRTNTSICAYSPRAKPSARVSMPVDWKELGAGPEKWTLPMVRGRLRRRRKDPWSGYWKARQRISPAAAKTLRQVRWAS